MNNKEGSEHAQRSLIGISLTKRDGLSLFLLFALWCFFLRNAFSDRYSFGLWMDNEFMIGTILSAISESLRAGTWPLRIDTLLGGFPLYNFTQFSIFYPFYLTPLPIFEGPIEVIHSLHWLTLLHLLVFQINMFILIRSVGASRIAAITGASLVAFSANSFIYASWINITAPYSWLPLYLAGLIGVLENPGLNTRFFQALIGMVLLTAASPAQPLIHAVYLTAVFYISYWLHKIYLKETSRIAYVSINIICLATISILLTAPILLPALLDYQNMIRWIGPFPEVVGNAPIPFEAFTFDQLSVRDLGSVFYNSKSAAVGSPFVGVIPMALAALSVFAKRQTWHIWALVFIAIYSVLSAAGSNLGFAHLNYVMPLLNKIREPSRFLILFQISVGVLAALGIDQLATLVMRTDNKRSLIYFASVGAAALFSVFIIPDPIDSYALVATSLIVYVVLIFLFCTLSNTSHPQRNILIQVIWSGGALILLASQVKWIPGVISSSIYLTKNGPQLDMAIARIKELDPNRNYRVSFDGKIEKPMASMLAAYRNVRTFNSFICPAPLRQFQDIYYHGPRFPSNYYRILGGKYLICSSCDDKSLIGYEYIETIAGYDLYQAQDVLPRSYIVSELSGRFIDLQDFLNKAGGSSLTNKILYVEAEGSVDLPKGREASNDCVFREEVRTVNYSQFILQCKSDGALVLNEYYDLAWRVKIDGVEGRPLKVNGNQVGAFFPSGSHIVEFEYAPKILWLSLLFMCFGIFAILVLYIFTRPKNVPFFRSVYFPKDGP